jgi:hypothetical protein
MILPSNLLRSSKISVLSVNVHTRENPRRSENDVGLHRGCRPLKSTCGMGAQFLCHQADLFRKPLGLLSG